WDLRLELQSLTRAALDAKPRTMSGLGVYAAIIALDSDPVVQHHDRPAGSCEHLAFAMAKAFIAITSGGAA
ncbi:hypothetical protein JG676_08610, partial [Campylobacter sp. 2018MI35]|uniref:hypothetical protein n=1 Tax=Campylobacter sp. 2018MI34 TaxID=2800582 RepID=UPI001A24462C